MPVSPIITIIIGFVQLVFNVIGILIAISGAISFIRAI